MPRSNHFVLVSPQNQVSLILKATEAYTKLLQMIAEWYTIFIDETYFAFLSNIFINFYI